MNFYHKCIYCDTVFANKQILALVKTKLELCTEVLDKGNTVCEWTGMVMKELSQKAMLKYLEGACVEGR